MSDHTPKAPETASDADLVLRTRSGDTRAFGELWARHHRSGIVAARSITSSFEADDLVQEAYARIFEAIGRGAGPTGSFRAYLFTSIRNTAAAWGRARRETAIDELDTVADPESTEQATDDALDRSLTVRAFRNLPSRWQEVLWYTEIEQMKPAEVAPLLGMSAGSVSQLAFRAREGLREAWIQAHLKSVENGSECQWTIESLGAYARGNLGNRAHARVEKHLAECARCMIVAGEAKDVSRRLALVLLPLILGVTGATAYAALLQTGTAVAAVAMPAAVTGTALAGAAGSTAGVGGATGTSAAAGAAGGGALSGAALSITAGLAAVVIAGGIAAATILPSVFGAPASDAAAPSTNQIDETAPPAASPQVMPEEPVLVEEPPAPAPPEVDAAPAPERPDPGPTPPAARPESPAEKGSGAGQTDSESSAPDTPGAAEPGTDEPTPGDDAETTPNDQSDSEDQSPSDPSPENSTEGRPDPDSTSPVTSEPVTDPDSPEGPEATDPPADPDPDPDEPQDPEPITPTATLSWGQAAVTFVGELEFDAELPIAGEPGATVQVSFHSVWDGSRTTTVTLDADGRGTTRISEWSLAHLVWSDRSIVTFSYTDDAEGTMTRSATFRDVGLTL